MLKSKEVFHHLIRVGFGTRMHDTRKDQSQTYVNVDGKNVNAFFIVEVHLAIKLVSRHSTVNKVKETMQA